MIKIPYGISNFEMLVSEGYRYIDRTPFIETLENLSQRYLFFVRPRRFGKSLFLSLLEYYYGIQYKDKFEALFSTYYIGQHPTKGANQFLILKFDFSRMNTSSYDATYQSFLQNVKNGAIQFFGQYSQFFDKEDITKVDTFTFPADVLQHVLLMIELKANKHKTYLLVDEYDHFANEILSFRYKEFSDMVSRNGFVRKFYEAVKVGTHTGVLNRIFITGVSPLTLDSLTSGFNISTNISLYEEFNGMMGFKEAEVAAILEEIEIPVDQLTIVLALMRKWYDGYLFAEEATEHIYNSDMVLYFASNYIRNKQYPKNLLDPNIASDYTKIRRLFRIKGQEEEHLKYLDELLQNGQIKAPLVELFEIDWRFDRKDFISLLYYTGVLTITGTDWAYAIFKMPNYVIEQLYYQYFYQIILERSQLIINPTNLNELMKSLATGNDMQPLVDYTQLILTELSNRDKMKFDERYIKLIFTSVFFTVGIYTIHNELEVKKSPTSRGYIDILLTIRQPYKTTYQFVIELKYVKKADADKAKEVQAAAVEQLQAYLQHDTYLQGLKNLRPYVVVFVGNEGAFVEVS